MSRPAFAILALLLAALVWIAAQMLQSEEGDEDVSQHLSETGDPATLLGKSYAEVQAVLGAPATEDIFTMSAGVSEFRIELRNIFDGSQTPEIREVTWMRSAEQNLTLWFADQDGASRAVHYKTWHPGDEF